METLKKSLVHLLNVSFMNLLIWRNFTSKKKAVVDRGPGTYQQLLSHNSSIAHLVAPPLSINALSSP
jgi:hypothetical protein